MMTASYNIVQEFPEMEYYINTSSITKSALDLSDEMKEKFQVKVSPQTIRNYRKKLPSHKIKCLREEKAKNIMHLQFVVDLLKEQVGMIEDPTLKLKFSQEIIRCAEKIDSIINDEIENLRNSRPF